MKKFISMVMAAAMVVSLVPATAFAANEATFKVVNDMEITKDDAKTMEAPEGAIGTLVEGRSTNMPQVQIKLKDVDSTVGKQDKFDIKLHFNNVEWVKTMPEGAPVADAYVVRTENNAKDENCATVTIADKFKAGDDTIELTIEEKPGVDFVDGDVIVIGLPGGTLGLTKTSEGTEATVKVTGDFGTSDEMTFLAVVEAAIDVEVDDTVDVAVEETAILEDITIEPGVGKTFSVVAEKGDTLTLKLSKGFEFDKTATAVIDFNTDGVADYTIPASAYDDNEIEFKVGDKMLGSGELTITGLVVEATTAKAGDVCTLTVDLEDCDSVKVEVATVCDFKVVMSVDEDEDVPVYYSGVNANNDGLTVDDKHESLEVTLKETFPGAWSMHKDFTLSLPEGVYVVSVDANDENGTLDADNYTDLNDVFEGAYIEGDHVSFEFDKRTFDETEADGVAPMNKEHEMTVVLELVADPGFVGDVVLTLEGDAVDTQEVTIAKFVSPMAVKAEANDLKIDYRYTEVGTDVVVTEAEAGLWAKDLEVGFVVDRGDMVNFEDDAVFTVNEDSDMEVEDFTVTDIGMMGFVVEEESDEVPAEITISNIELFMQRNIPAGPYDLEMYYGLNVTKVVEAEKDNEKDEVINEFVVYDAQQLLGQDECNHKDCETRTVDDVCDYSDVVKEGWINVVTAGREADDASFTTKVVVPVGEAYIIAGETQVALDVPAYVNAAGYTMLPVRAVAVALGINTQNVLWDQATKTVTILYGQRIITMQVGAKVVYVNGSAIPASASVEIVDGRTFLPMRDLATALGVTDITWDAATKTATLNGNA